MLLNGVLLIECETFVLYFEPQKQVQFCRPKNWGSTIRSNFSVQFFVVEIQRPISSIWPENDIQKFRPKMSSNFLWAGNPIRKINPKTYPTTYPTTLSNFLVQCFSHQNSQFYQRKNWTGKLDDHFLGVFWTWVRCWGGGGCLGLGGGWGALCG